MIQIYSPFNTDFDKNGDAVLLNAMSCDHTSELNGAWEIELENPLDDRFQYIVKNSVIAAPTPQGNKQLFRVYQTERSSDSVVAYARPIFYDAAKTNILVDVRPTNLNGQAALDYILAGTQYSGESDIEDVNTAYYVRKNALEAINGTDDNSFINRWGGEIEFDNFKIIVKKQIGSDNGLRVEFGRNIQSIKETINTEDMATRVCPVAYNERMLDEIYVDSDRINDYPTVFCKVIEYSNIRFHEDYEPSDDEELDEGIEVYETMEELQQALREAVAADFADGLDLPTLTYEIDMIDLRRADEYKDFRNLESVALGDTVHCYHRILGIETDQRVVALTYDCITESITKITLGDLPKESSYWDSVSGVLQSAVTEEETDDDIQRYLSEALVSWSATWQEDIDKAVANIDFSAYAKYSDLEGYATSEAVANLKIELEADINSAIASIDFSSYAKLEDLENWGSSEAGMAFKAEMEAYADKAVEDIDLSFYVSYEDLGWTKSDAETTFTDHLEASIDKAINQIDFSSYATLEDLENWGSSEAGLSFKSDMEAYTDSAIGNIDMSAYVSFEDLGWTKSDAETTFSDHMKATVDEAINEIDFSSYATLEDLEEWGSSEAGLEFKSDMEAYTDKAVGNIDFSAYVSFKDLGWSTTEAGLTFTSYMEASINDAISSLDLSVYVTTEEYGTFKSGIYEYVDDSIANLTISVSGSLGGTASIMLSTGSKDTTAKLSLEDVRKAFANDDTDITIAAGVITLDGGLLEIVGNYLTVDSTNFQLSKDGTLTAQNAVLDGSLTAYSGKYYGELSGANLTFGYDGTAYSRILNAIWDGDTSKRGIAIMGTVPGKFIGIGKMGVTTEPDTADITGPWDSSEGDYTSWYTQDHNIYGSQAKFLESFFSERGGVDIDKEGSEPTHIFRGASFFDPSFYFFLPNPSFVFLLNEEESKYETLETYIASGGGTNIIFSDSVPDTLEEGQLCLVYV